VVLLRDAEDQCDCDWWCWLEAITLFAAAAACAIAAGPMAGAAAAEFASTLVGLGVAVGVIGAGVFFQAAGMETLTCDNVPQVTARYETALAGLRQGLREVEAELNHALMRRDVLIANINALSQELSEVYQSNAAR